MRSNLARLITPRVSGVAGLAVLGSVLGGSLTALRQHPDYSLLQDYVSQLASRRNPGHGFFDGGLLAGGVFLVIFAPGLASLVTGPYGRRAAWLGGVAGAAMVAVGLFPLTEPVMHFGCAFVLFTAAIFATLFMGLGLLHAPGAPRSRRRVVGWALVGVFGIMVAMTLAGFAQWGEVQSGGHAGVGLSGPRHGSERSSTILPSLPWRLFRDCVARTFSA